MSELKNYWTTCFKKRLVSFKGNMTQGRKVGCENWKRRWKDQTAIVIHFLTSEIKMDSNTVTLLSSSLSSCHNHCHHIIFIAVIVIFITKPFHPSHVFFFCIRRGRVCAREQAQNMNPACSVDCVEWFARYCHFISQVANTFQVNTSSQVTVVQRYVH